MVRLEEFVFLFIRKLWNNLNFIILFTTLITLFTFIVVKVITITYEYKDSHELNNNDESLEIIERI